MASTYQTTLAPCSCGLAARMALRELSTRTVEATCAEDGNVLEHIASVKTIQQLKAVVSSCNSA